MSLKGIIEMKCRFRVVDFEQAQRIAQENGLQVQFSRFDYGHDLFIWKVIGVVGDNGDRLRVEWNCEGKAFINKRHIEKYDLKFNGL